jgi:hypothetical protein
MNFQYIIYEDQVNSVYLDILPTLISSLIIILVFVLERFYHAKFTKAEIYRTWYLRVIIEPNLNNIENFFSSVIANYNESFDIIRTNTTLPHDEFLILKATEITKFQNIKNSFEFSFTILIANTYPQVGREIDKIIMEIQDSFTANINEIEQGFDNRENYSRSIVTYKAALLQTLFSPL